MTRLLIYVTAIFLIIGIPSALADLVQPSRGQWIHWVLIASAVLAALWILRLIIWIKRKIEEKVSYRDMNVSTSKPTLKANRVPPPHGTIYVSPDGTATDTPPPNTSETLETHEFVEPMQNIKSEREATHMGVWQGINNQKLDKIVQEGRLTPREALEFQRAIEKAGDDLFSQERLGNLLQAIDQGAESERQEHERLQDSILKKYGIDPNKFRL